MTVRKDGKIARSYTLSASLKAVRTCFDSYHPGQADEAHLRVVYNAALCWKRYLKNEALMATAQLSKRRRSLPSR